jgi:hypothetical protein
LKYHVRLPEADLVALNNITARLNRRVTGMTDKNRERLAQFQDPRVLARFLAQPRMRGLSGPEHAELVERAGHGAHRSGRDLGVEGGVVQLRVPKQDLDDADINAVLEEMGGETVP